jgi:hypothetical protein
MLALTTRKIQASGRDHAQVGGNMTQKVRQKLKLAGYRSRYRLRKQIVEPVLGRSSKHVDFDNSSCIALRHAGRAAADLHHP